MSAYGDGTLERVEHLALVIVGGWVHAQPVECRSPLGVRRAIRTIMAKSARWLAAEHPEITAPGQWTRQTSAARVAAVDRMTVGDYVQRRDHLHQVRREQYGPVLTLIRSEVNDEEVRFPL
ncbi:hypothetical protein [Rhodococcus jostii]|uniref:hypothetical protein n=1 Tax=Rhodococcus jostii TaxID=132919 RepID=UPI0005A15F74|nr:hypothetical protein [Rhodococcus jostii]